jgi:hypothetical protein
MIPQSRSGEDIHVNHDYETSISSPFVHMFDPGLLYETSCNMLSFSTPQAPIFTSNDSLNANKSRKIQTVTSDVDGRAEKPFSGFSDFKQRGQEYSDFNVSDFHVEVTPIKEIQITECHIPLHTIDKVENTSQSLAVALCCNKSNAVLSCKRKKRRKAKILTRNKAVKSETISSHCGIREPNSGQCVDRQSAVN